MNLNISNVSTPLYNALLERKGKLHFRTWAQYLEWSLQDPEGNIDFDVLSVNGNLPDVFGRIDAKIVFRSGNFVYEYDGTKKKDEQFTLVTAVTKPTISQLLEVGRSSAKSPR